MSAIRIAAAQSISVPGDIAANVLTHTQCMQAAQRAQVDLLVFPELSLCGYELPLLPQCVLQADDSRLAPIRDMAAQSNMTVVVGAPVASAAGALPHIATITFYPNGGYAVYRKQHLHPGEELFATKGALPSHMDALCGESTALAICADTSHAAHALHAAQAGATLYLAGVLVSEAGFAADAARMQHYAASLHMGVLMANHGGPTGAYVSAGKSAFWAPGGRLVVQAPGVGNVLVVADNRTGEWAGALHPVEN